MTTYRICWEIDIDADTPLEAARRAREIQLDPDSTATEFTVADATTTHTIDIAEHP